MNGRSPVSDIFSGLQDVLTLQGKALQLKFYKTAAESAAAALRGLLVAMAGLVTLLFLSAGLALWLGESMGSYPLGFFLVGAFYLAVLIAVTIYTGHRRSELRSMVIRQLTGNEQSYEQVVEEELQVRQVLDQRKKVLQDNLLELQQSLKKLEERFGPLMGTKTAEPGEPVKKSTRLLSGLTDLVLGALLTPKASLVKELVLPAVTRAVMSARMRKSSGSGGLFSGLIGRLFKRP